MSICDAELCRVSLREMSALPLMVLSTSGRTGAGLILAVQGNIRDKIFLILQACLQTPVLGW